jgi:membrane associated rhomboid family serine protease
LSSLTSDTFLVDFLRRRPFTVGVVTVITAAFAIEIAQSGPSFWIFGDGDVPDIVAQGAVWRPAIEAGEWWRLFTAAFLHFGLLHFALNAVALLVIGIETERRLGSMRTAVVFVAASVGGNIAAAAFEADSLSAGASGGVMGLGGAVLLAAYRSKESIERIQWILGAITATIVYGFLHAGISNAAHIGGLLAGTGVELPIGGSADYAMAMQRERAAREAQLEAIARRVAAQPSSWDLEAEPDMTLRPSWSFLALLVLGLALFGLPLILFRPVELSVLSVLCAVFVTVAGVGLLSLPWAKLVLNDWGIVYRAPYFLRTAKVPWTAVLDVSKYDISSGYGNQSFAKVTYVRSGPKGPRERRMLLNRLGNLKTEKLIELIRDYRARAKTSAGTARRPEGGTI